METDEQIVKIQTLLNKLHEMNDQEARVLYLQQFDKYMKEYQKIQKTNNTKNKSNRKLAMPSVGGGAGGMGGAAGGGSAVPTIINIPVPKITETELEVVHVFPQGYPSGNGYPQGGGYGGGGFTPDLIPSYSVTSNVNGNESTSNFWGFNPSRNLKLKNQS